MEPISYQTRGVMTGSLGMAIALVTLGAMSFMFVLILIGTPMPITVVLFLGATVLGLMTIGGDAEYRVTDQGLERKVTSMLFHRVKEESFPWSMVRSYKEGRDLNRSWREYHFLEIHFRKAGTRWKLTGEDDSPAFFAFKAAFIDHVEALNRRHAKGSSDGNPTEVRPIARKPVFYDTLWAKVFTALSYLFLAGVGVIYLAAPQLLGFTDLVRLVLVTLPGVIYLSWRMLRHRRLKTKNGST